jgi:SAM-dependent methyltransferase
MPEVYDRLLGAAVFHPFAVDLARRAAALRPGAVLELAAGTGIVTRELVAALPEAAVTATDLNRAMVAWGARAVPTARWAAADAQRPPFADGRFDLVACQFGVMFFPDRPAAFAQMLRVLAPGGRLLFNTWDTVERHGFGDATMAGLRQAFPDDPPPFLTAVPHGYHDPDRIRADVESGGFTDVALETITCTGHASSAADIAVGFCTGSPVRADIESRGDLVATTALVEGVVAGILGSGPITADMVAHVVTARRA